MIAPSVHGWSADIDKVAPVDLEGAKKLLAEAGYPNGFSFQLDCPNDSSVNTIKIQPAGLEVDNSGITREVSGIVTGAEVADLDAFFACLINRRDRRA